MNIIKYETTVEDMLKLSSEVTGKPVIFLAGPTVRGNQPHLTSWRREAEAEFAKQGFDGTLIVPEFEDKLESDQYRYDIPEWEFEGLKMADVIMFWVCRTRELIGLTTNFEFGYWIARERSKIVYGRPDDAYRIKYGDIMWHADAKESMLALNSTIHKTLADTVSASIKISNVLLEEPLIGRQK
jgi:nucleoside 2-deoxyribosyltransferase